MMIRGLAASSAALRLAGGFRSMCCQATAFASLCRTAPRGNDDTEPRGKFGRAPGGGRSGPGFVLPHLQARREMIRWLVVVGAALGLRAVAPSAQTGGLLRKLGSYASMADGKLNSNYAFKPTADPALRSNQLPRRGGLMRR